MEHFISIFEDCLLKAMGFIFLFWVLLLLLAGCMVEKGYFIAKALWFLLCCWLATQVVNSAPEVVRLFTFIFCMIVSFGGLAIINSLQESAKKR